MTVDIVNTDRSRSGREIISYFNMRFNLFSQLRRSNQVGLIYIQIQSRYDLVGTHYQLHAGSRCPASIYSIRESNLNLLVFHFAAKLLDRIQKWD